MKQLLLIILFLLILPVSNELIQQNMWQHLLVPQYVIYNLSQKPHKAPTMNRKTFYASDGTPFTITWWTGIGLLVDRDKVYVINDGGLNLDVYYDNEAALFAAILEALDNYNRQTPINGIMCLLLFSGLYWMYVWNKLCRLGKTDCRRLD